MARLYLMEHYGIVLVGFEAEEFCKFFMVVINLTDWLVMEFGCDGQ